MTQELWKKWRPKDFDELVGQEGIVPMLKKMVKEEKVPHAILLTGNSGCGKTTTARILAGKLGATDNDFNEINAANARGIDEIREINRRLSYRPWGKATVYLIDEAHAITPDAQSAMLKMLEDTPAWVYFMLATTDPTKLKPTIRNRCTELAVKPLADDDMAALIGRVARAEKFSVEEAVVDRIKEVTQGSARMAIKLLEQAMQFDDEESQVAAITGGETTAQVIDLCRAMWKPNLKTLMGLARKIEDEPEKVRRIILGYFRKVMLDKPSEQVYKILRAFERNYFDSGAAGIAISLWEVCN